MHNTEGMNSIWTGVPLPRNTSSTRRREKVHSPADWRLYLKTSQRTSLLGSLRKGSRNIAAGRRYMSLLEPSDWKVLEPSKFHSGRSGVERGTRHSDQGSLVTRVGSPPPSSITEMKMLVWDRPTIGLIPAQLVLFQMGEVKKPKHRNKQKTGECTSPTTLGNTRSWAAGQAQANRAALRTFSMSQQPRGMSRAPSLLAEVPGQAGRGQSFKL